jgi:hypothetical protein
MPMNYYVPHYPPGIAFCSKDIFAKQQLRREIGLRVIDEVWVPMDGIVPLYELNRALTTSELDVLKLKEFNYK